MNPPPTPTLSLDEKDMALYGSDAFCFAADVPRTLFFSLTQLGDPLEGYLPRSHVEAFAAMFEDNLSSPMAALRPAFEAKSPEHSKTLDEIIAAARNDIPLEC
jgi:uncharacterized alpha-E superfamily protein